MFSFCLKNALDLCESATFTCRIHPHTRACTNTHARSTDAHIHTHKHICTNKTISHADIHFSLFFSFSCSPPAFLSFPCKSPSSVSFRCSVSIGGGCPDEKGGGGFGICPRDCLKNSDCTQNNSLCCPAACGGHRCLVRCPKLTCSKACSTGYVLSNNCPTCTCKGEANITHLSF